MWGYLGHQIDQGPFSLVPDFRDYTKAKQGSALCYLISQGLGLSKVLPDRTHSSGKASPFSVCPQWTIVISPSLQTGWAQVSRLLRDDPLCALPFKRLTQKQGRKRYALI